MIYQAGILTAILTWMLNETGALPRIVSLLPIVPFYEYDLTFFLLHAVIFSLVFIALTLLRRRYGSPLRSIILGAASSYGVARLFDWALLLALLFVVIGAVGVGRVSPYLICVIVLGLAAAIESVVAAPGPVQPQSSPNPPQQPPIT